MKKYLIAGAIVAVLGVGGFVIAQGFFTPFLAHLNGYEEVPAVSTSGNAEFRADLIQFGNQLQWELTYRRLEGNITQAHIHFAQPGVNGAVVVFLCSNLNNGPPGTQLCPPPPATVRGIISAADIGGGASGQGIAAGEFDEFLRAMRRGATYVNVHTSTWPGGEVRSQIRIPPPIVNDNMFRSVPDEQVIDDGTKPGHTGH